jgi:hypothetical protein
VSEWGIFAVLVSWPLMLLASVALALELFFVRAEAKQARAAAADSDRQRHAAEDERDAAKARIAYLEFRVQQFTFDALARNVNYIKIHKS